MFRNNFKIAWRNLVRNKAYTFINVTGLSLGIACGIVIFTVVSYHLSFDDYHTNKERIYRVVTEFHEDQIDYSQGVPSVLGKAFRNDFTYAETVARVLSTRSSLISLPSSGEVKKFLESGGVAFAEPGYFSILDFPLVQGDQTAILSQPNTALITQHVAQKYFGTENAIGRLIKFDNTTVFKVTGILKDLPDNTDRRQEIYLSYANLKDYNPKLAADSNWGNVGSRMQCFLLLKPGITKATVDNAFPNFVKKYYKGDDVKVYQFKLQPLSDIHFNPKFDGYVNKTYLWALFFIALFLIITACVNFINLATAQALNRSKEVGIRKVLGSLQHQLFWQFIAETTLITVFALLVACGLSVLAVPWLNGLLNTKMHLYFFSRPQLPIFLGGLTLLVIFLAGSYPGLVLARFQPILALKSRISQNHIGGFSLRRVLVVTQFAISQMLIIGAIVIAGQMNFSKTADLGFKKDAIVMLPLPVSDLNRISTMGTRLQGLAGVQSVSFCFQPPASESNNTTDVRFEGRAKDEPWEVNMKQADDQYINTFGLKIIAGRNFYKSDTARELLVNETFVKKLGFRTAREVLGKRVNVDGENPVPIVGVVKDFFNRSFHEDVAPIIIRPNHAVYGKCAVKIAGGNIKPVLAQIEKTWNKTYYDYVFSYQFLDDSIAKFYELDNVMLMLIEAFAIIAVFIGCLGLYGLVSFMAVRKTKEIGVRKVLGAGMQQILWLFGREFSKLLLIAFVIAAPIAWWVMNLYLQDFKYRISIGAGIFALSISITFLVACLTVGYRSLRAALANPVKSLRTE